MSRGTLLLVDDDRLFQTAALEALEREGFEVRWVVASGDEAVLLLLGDARPDLVLMDLNLDGALSGIETADRMLEVVDVPVVFLSAVTDNATLDRVFRAASYGFVAKPVRSEQLVAAIDTALHRHRLDRQVQESRDWLSTVLGSITDGVVSTDIEGSVTFANAAARVFVGGPLEGKSLAEVLSSVAPESADEVERFMGLLGTLDSETVLDRLISGVAADGQSRTVHVTARSLRDSVARPIGSVVIMRDVTERERLIRELESFKMAVDAMQIGVTMTDLNRTILYANRAEAEMHGVEPQELIGRSSQVLGANFRSEDHSVGIEKPSRWRRQSVNRRADGSTFPVQLFSDVVRNADGKPVGLVTCCEDRTERARVESEIRKLNRAVEQSPALVIITDVNGAIEYVNERFMETTGYSREEVLGKNPRILKSGETGDEVYRDMWATITRGGTWNGEIRNRRKGGGSYWAFASISGLRNDAGDIKHYVGVQVDITPLKEMERQLAEKNRDLSRLNRLKSDMVAVTSHDLKSPLHAMISIANLLKEMGDDLSRDATARYIDRIIVSGRKLSAFISEVLDAEKIESGGLSLSAGPARMDVIVTGCVEVARLEGREKDLAIRLETAESGGFSMVDRGRLEQVFGNLLSNAVKFSPVGAIIEVTVCRVESEDVVTVSDRGPGIPEADLQKIFDRYYQVHSAGAVAERGFGVGLGLYITRELVELHGGSIEAANRTGGGCRFVVRLPAGGAGTGGDDVDTSAGPRGEE